MPEDREREDCYPWAPVVGASIVLILISLIALTAVAGWTWTSQFLGGPASDWAQAIGAVAAIYYSGRVARTQIVETRRWDVRKTLEAERRYLSTVVALIAAPIAVCNLLHHHWDRRTHRLPERFSEKYWEEARVAIAAIDPFACPDESLVVTLAQVPRQLDMLIAASRDYQGALSSGAGRDVLDKVGASFFRELHEALNYLTDVGNTAANGVNERAKALVRM